MEEERASVIGLNEKIHKLIDSYRTIKSRLEEVNKENGELRHKLENIKNDSDKNQSENLQKISMLENQLTECRHKNDELSKKITEYETKLKVVSDEVDSVLSDAHEL